MLYIPTVIPTGFERREDTGVEKKTKSHLALRALRAWHFEPALPGQTLHFEMNNHAQVSASWSRAEDMI